MTRTEVNERLYDLGLFFLFLAIFAGRFSLDRLLKTQMDRWGSIELWATSGVLLVVYLLARRGFISLGLPDRQTKLFIGAVLTLYLLLTVNLILLSNQAAQTRGLLDHLFLAVHVSLIIAIISSPVMLRRICRIIVASTVFLGTLWVIGTSMGYESTLMRMLLQSKLTIYRLEFFGFACALHTAYSDRMSSWKNYYLIAAAFLLFTVLISAAFAAVAGAFLAIIWMLLWQLSNKNYREAICLITISCLSTGFLVVSKADFYASQVSYRLSGSGTFSYNIGWKNGRDERIISMINSLRGNSLPHLSDLNGEDRQILETYALLYNLRIPQHGEELLRFLWGLSHRIVIFDGSERINYTIAALRDWSEQKVFGQGLGNYSVSNIIIGTNKLETVHYPHNVFLEMLVGAGIIGFGAFCLALFVTFVLVHQACLHFFPNTAFLGAMVFYLLSASFAGDYYDFRLFWVSSLFALCTNRES